MELADSPAASGAESEHLTGYFPTPLFWGRKMSQSLSFEKSSPDIIYSLGNESLSLIKTAPISPESLFQESPGASLCFQHQTHPST